tara:strand:+ start:6939 stop:7262 length:324 start_codon:yes stop_codon:yes gene_type:complete
LDVEPCAGAHIDCPRLRRTRGPADADEHPLLRAPRACGAADETEEVAAEELGLGLQGLAAGDPWQRPTLHWRIGTDCDLGLLLNHKSVLVTEAHLRVVAVDGVDAKP